ncbi:MAG: NERD domain-containing protein [Acidimicrobiia bacterium]|nr:NERD domain-containing protein [Acidimicrobiia bacterium]
MAARLIRLRYASACSACGVELCVRSEAWWDREARTVRCPACGASTGEPGETPARRSAPPGRSPGAGSSAQREYERRKAKREADLRARHPRLGGLVSALSGDPQSTTAWAKGADGERRLGARLDSLPGCVALHDRRLPGSRANIDHLVVAPSGVWVIDAKHYRGRVAMRDVGGWTSVDRRLRVGGRDRTKLVKAMAQQVTAVRQVLDARWSGVPIRPVLCFVGADWPLLAKPFEIDGVVIAWPRAVARLVRGSGPSTPEGVRLVAHLLDTALVPA